MRDALLVIAHGSHDPDNIADFRSLIDKVRTRSQCPVEGAFLDYLEPGIPAGIESCRATGAERIWVVPCFLFEGRHVREDIPAILRRIGPKHPGVSIELTSCVGRDAALGDLFAARVAEAERDLSSPAFDPAVVFVAGGSKNPEANAALVREADRYRLTRKNRARVGHAFLDMASPTLEEALINCLESGHHQVILQPYFLFMGTLVKRIAPLADDLRLRRPELRTVVARPLGPDDRIAEMILNCLPKTTDEKRRTR